MNIWRLIAHWWEPEKVVAWSRANNRIGIGWNPGSLRQYASPREISEAVRETHPGLHNWPYSGQQLWDFSRVIRQDDLVILSTGACRAAVMQITGEYEYHHDSPDGLHHQRAAVETHLDPDQIWKTSGGCAPGYNIRWTLIRCQYPLDEMLLSPAMGRKEVAS